MHVQARRVFRLALTIALALAIAYGMGTPLPFIAPIFALVLAAPPAPPMGIRSLFSLTLLVVLTLGVGLLVVPLLIHYPVAAVMIVAVGLFFSNYVAINLGKAMPGLLLTMGITLISSAGTVDYTLAYTVILALVVGIIIAVACHRMVYPWFPENATPSAAAQPVTTPDESRWIALRATLVVIPAFLLALTNPATYLPIMMKATALAQEASVTSARDAGRELLGSTLLGGCFAIGFWFALDINTSLWMFFLWMLLFGLFFTSRIYGVSQSRYPMTIWPNVTITMLILLGSAVQDSADGKDVYQAFAVRMGLFVGVTFYAWFAIAVLERWRARRLHSAMTQLQL